MCIVPLENVVEVRFGAAARLMRESFKVSPLLEPRWLTVVYALGSRWKLLHIVAPDEEVRFLLRMSLPRAGLSVELTDGESLA